MTYPQTNLSQARDTTLMSTRLARRQHQRDMSKAIKRAKRKLSAANRLLAYAPAPYRQQFQHLVNVYGRLPNVIVGIARANENPNNTRKTIKALSSILDVPCYLTTATESLTAALPSPTERVMFVVLSEGCLRSRSELQTPEWTGRVEVYSGEWVFSPTAYSWGRD